MAGCCLFFLANKFVPNHDGKGHHGLENHNNEFLLDQSQHQSSSRRSLLTSVGTTQKRTWITVSLKQLCWKGNCFGSGCHEPQIWMHPGFKDQYSENFKRSTMFKQDALRQLPYPSGQMSQVPRTRLTWLTWHLPKKVSPTHQLTSNQSLNTCNGGAQFIHGRFSTGHDLRLQSGEVTTLGPWELPPEREQVVKNCNLSDFCWFLGKLGQQYFLNLFKSAEIFIGPPGLMIIQQEWKHSMHFFYPFWSLLYLVHWYGE